MLQGIQPALRNPRIVALTLGCVTVAAVARTGARDITVNAPPPSPQTRVNYLSWLDAALRPQGVANAARDYLAAAADLSPPPPGQTLERAAAGPWSGQPDVQAWIDKNRRPLGLVASATETRDSYLGLRPAADPPGGREWADALLAAGVPGLGSIDTTVTGLLADGWRDAESGDYTRIVDRAVITIAIAHHLQAEPPLVAKLASLQMAERGYRTLIAALHHSRHRAELAAALAERLAKIDPPLESMTTALSFQRLTAWDLLQRMYQPNPGAADQPSTSTEQAYRYLASLSPQGAPSWDQVRASLAGRTFDDDLRETNLFFDRLLAWSEEPAHVALPREDEVNRWADAIGNLMVRSLVADIATPRRVHARVITTQRGLRLLLQILNFHRQQNRYPTSLGDIACPVDVPDCRTDPYSGADFIYSPTREAFVLYSPGPDKKDDASRPYLPNTESGDLVLWPLRAEH